MFQCLLLLMTCILVSSCGKKGPVEPLEPSDYPRTYPKPPEPEFASMKKPNKVDPS
jgi:predicted small lipoprotein YifL